MSTATDFTVGDKVYVDGRPGFEVVAVRLPQNRLVILPTAGGIRFICDPAAVSHEAPPTPAPDPAERVTPEEVVAEGLAVFTHESTRIRLVRELANARASVRYHRALAAAARMRLIEFDTEAKS